jgi:UDP-N-acetylglucosamine--N-acetylmuramyl-(pentapeptide) pyrophosphoryl-undecaprenol N-acetylglucosamine transferase
MTTMLVASTGGHLTQLHRLAKQVLPEDEPRVWLTFDTPQSRSLLDGEEVVHVPYVSPRDVRGVLGAMPAAARALRDHQVDQVLSTGSAVALSVIPLARARGITCRYIESAARASGPSVTGRLLELVPGTQRYTQYQTWDRQRWRVGPSVFDGFAPVPATADGPIRRVVVTLGTIEGYGFRSLLERLLEILPADCEVLWQTGDTETNGLPLEATPVLPYRDLLREIARADVVVAHAGIGSALTALECGRAPVLVPRRESRGEHVDDHQQQIAHELDHRGLALAREVEDLTLDDLHESRTVTIVPPEQAGPVVVDLEAEAASRAPAE